MEASKENMDVAVVLALALRALFSAAAVAAAAVMLSIFSLTAGEIGVLNPGISSLR